MDLHNGPVGSAENGHCAEPLRAQTTRMTSHPLARIAIALATTLLALPTASAGTPKTTPPSAPRPAEARDGQHDFDFLFGKWNVTVRRLKNPLHGSTEWYEM